ncbi:MAG: GumC family protein, partial [Chitinophagaceae bacterium]
VNVDNEIELIKSKKNLVRIVERKQFNISYYNEGNVKRTNAYTSCPIILEPTIIPDSNRGYAFYVKNLSEKGGLLKYSMKQADEKGVPFQWNKPIEFAGFTFKLVKRNPEQYFELNTAASPYFIVWNPCMQKAAEIKGGLGVAPSGTKTTILNLSLVTANPQEGIDILNALIEDYNQKNIEDKNEVSANTIRFIDERLKLVSGELKAIEDSLNDFKTANQIIDIKKQAEDFFTEITNSQKAADEIMVQSQLLKWLDSYMQQASNKYRLVPTTLTLNDPTLGGLIGTYNTLQLERQKLALSVLPNNAKLLEINHQLEEVRKNMLESIQNLKRYFQTQEQNAKNKASKNQSILESLPSKERTIYEIERQKSIKQALFVYLLQKKEETAISASSTISNYQQIDTAEASWMPIEPRAGEVRNYSIILGLLIPIGLIYIRDLFNDKVTNRDDITKRTQLSIVGEISHVDNVKGNIVVVGQSRSIIAEQFRVMRSNLQFMTKFSKQCSTFLITSSVSGEGKSFISLNTAAVLSLSGKKVALLEFDLRKMRSIKHTGEIGTEKGIANYLIGQVDNPMDIISPIPSLPNLHLFHSGPIAPNPAELMMSERVKLLFDWLKERYDYIIIDSAPVGLVSDSYALMDYCDALLYVVRQRYTFKRQIDFLEEIRNQEKIK